MTQFRFRLACAMACLIVSANTPTIAQAPPQLNENQKAVISFDLRMEKMMAGSAAAGADIQPVSELPLEGDILDGLYVSDLKRIFGATSLPGDIAQIMQMGPDSELPMEFFFRIQFMDSAACDLLENNIINAEGTRTKELGGKTFLQPPAGDGPDNMVGHRIDETTFEIGTVNYCLQPDRTFFSDRLKTTWKQVPDDAFRLAVDLETRADLIQEALAMGKQGAPPQIGPFLDLVDNFNSLVISADLEQANLLTLVINGVDEDQAEELRSGLDSLLGMAKMAGQMQLGQISKDMPEVGTVAKNVLAALNAKREGLVVTVTIPKPEGFAQAITELQRVSQTQAKDAQRMNNFRQVALAFHNYADAYRNFPFDVAGRDGQNNDLSWRARVLPFMEENEMYDQMDMSKGPNEAPNAQFANQMPKLFGADGANSTISWIKPPQPVDGFPSITDGASNTIMLLENPAGQPWLENNFLTVDEAVELVSGLKDGEELIAALYDGSTRKLTSGIDQDTLKNLFDPADGNVIENF